MFSSDAIIVAIITGVASIAGQLIISSRGRKERQTEEALKDQATALRLDAIEHKLDIHNGYAEKLGDIQQSIAVIQTKITDLESR